MAYSKREHTHGGVYTRKGHTYLRTNIQRDISVDVYTRWSIHTEMTGDLLTQGGDIHTEECMHGNDIHTMYTRRGDRYGRTNIQKDICMEGHIHNGV